METLSLYFIQSNRTTFQDLSKIFPNVTELYVWPSRSPFIQYADLWASDWSKLELLSLDEGRAALEENFDAEFLGMYPEEVDLLRELDDAALQTLHIVPVRPSILTMKSKSVS